MTDKGKLERILSKNLDILKDRTKALVPELTKSHMRAVVYEHAHISCDSDDIDVLGELERISSLETVSQNPATPAETRGSEYNVDPFRFWVKEKRFEFEKPGYFNHVHIKFKVLNQDIELFLENLDDAPRLSTSESVFATDNRKFSALSLIPNIDIWIRYHDEVLSYFSQKYRFSRSNDPSMFYRHLDNDKLLILSYNKQRFKRNLKRRIALPTHYELYYFIGPIRQQQDITSNPSKHLKKCEYLGVLGNPFYKFHLMNMESYSAKEIRIDNDPHDYDPPLKYDVPNSPYHRHSNVESFHRFEVKIQNYAIYYIGVLFQVAYPHVCYLEKCIKDLGDSVQKKTEY